MIMRCHNISLRFVSIGEDGNKTSLNKLLNLIKLVLLLINTNLRFGARKQRVVIQFRLPRTSNVKCFENGDLRHIFQQCSFLL